MSDRALIRAAVVFAGAAFGAVMVLAVVEGRTAPTAANPPQVVLRQVPQSPPLTDTVSVPLAPPARPVQGTGDSSAETHTRPAPADALFWRLIEATRRDADNDTGRQSGLLKDRLTDLSPQAILEFERTRQRLDRRLYSWKIWGAAAVIEDGCSDDCFRDFRAYVISLGREPYERALRNPDSLASVAQEAETGDWENADDVAPDAYSSVTGNDFPLDDADLSGRPAGRPVSLSDPALRRNYPRLAERFRHN